MKSVGEHGKRWIAFGGLFLVFASGAYLRFSGIRWGLDTGYSHNRGFQPDEFVSLRGVLPIDVRAGRLKAQGAYFEGTFNYYLWDIPVVVKESLTGRQHQSATYSKDEFKFALLSGRTMTVAFDLFTALTIFLIIREAGGSCLASILGGFFYCIVPMQVIYAHFMRPHVLINLVFALVFWQSLLLFRNFCWWRFLLIGTLSGLAAATRYPMGIIVALPILLLLFRPVAAGQTRKGPALVVGRRINFWIICWASLFVH
jgi:hypothetical protein